MDRAQKPVVVADLNASFKEVGVVVVTRNLGLTVAQSTQLRNKMREAGATYKVTKNSLTKIAAKGSVREIFNSVGAHAAEVLTSPALAKAYAARLVTFAAADDPRDDAQRMADATAKVIAKATEKMKVKPAG